VPALVRYCVVALLACAAGCGKMQEAANRAKLTNDAKEMGLQYMKFQLIESRPPASFAELKAKVPDITPSCEGVTMVWGAGMAELCKDGAASQTVIGSVSTGPGTSVALMCDGSVQQVTNDELASMKKAQPLKK
jgi:hypothetical protein